MVEIEKNQTLNNGFGDDVNTFIDLSLPFFDLEYERSKIRGLRL